LHVLVNIDGTAEVAIRVGHGNSHADYQPTATESHLGVQMASTDQQLFPRRRFEVSKAQVNERAPATRGHTGRDAGSTRTASGIPANSRGPVSIVSLNCLMCVV
jgi:hypothetical protein